VEVRDEEDAEGPRGVEEEQVARGEVQEQPTPVHHQQTDLLHRQDHPGGDKRRAANEMRSLNDLNGHNDLKRNSRERLKQPVVRQVRHGVALHPVRIQLLDASDEIYNKYLQGIVNITISNTASSLLQYYFN